MVNPGSVGHCSAKHIYTGGKSSRRDAVLSGTTANHRARHGNNLQRFHALWSHNCQRIAFGNHNRGGLSSNLPDTCNRGVVGRAIGIIAVKLLLAIAYEEQRAAHTAGFVNLTIIGEIDNLCRNAIGSFKFPELDIVVGILAAPEHDIVHGRKLVAEFLSVFISVRINFKTTPGESTFKLVEVVFVESGKRVIATVHSTFLPPSSRS